ncbi:MAG: hypothetical protein D6699_03565, partial [Aquificota bacterium]
TLLSGMSLVGKELVFSTNSIDTVKGGKYYLLSSQEVKDATVKIMDGDTTVKELKVDLKRGLNTLDLSGLPKANARVITSSNTVLEDTINLVR